MRTTASLLLTGIAVAAAPLAAQQQLEIFPMTAEFTSRGNVDSNSGETFMGFHAATHRGLGDVGGRCEILGMTATIQDQNTATQETYGWVIRNGDDDNGPSRAAGDLITLVTGNTTPLGVGGIKSWNVSTVFSAPVKPKDCLSFFAAGIALSPTTWNTDGLSTHAATKNIQDSHDRQGDHAWQFSDGTTTTATHPSHKRTFKYGILLPNAVLQMGTGNNYAMGGMYPHPGRQLTARIRAGSALGNAASVVVLSTKQYRLNGAARIGLGAGIYLAPSYHFFFTSTDATGEAQRQILSSVPAGFVKAGTFHFQAVVDKNGALYFSNAATVIP